MRIAVIDGMGGGLGVEIIEQLKSARADIEILALGVNSTATTNMVKAGAHRGATGENAVRVTTREVDVIAGPLGIIIPHSMMGEITPAVAEAVAESRAKKFLLCINQPHVELIYVEPKPVSALIKRLVERIVEYQND
jgi:hypothetical protein